MMLVVLLSLALANPQTDDPPAVTVQLNHDQFGSGDRARVYVQTARDGYLIVLHADPAGRVRVLFPLDPSDDDFVRGGRRQELRGRSDRDAFQVDAEDGAGTVLAAVAPDPFKFDAFVRNDHWDFRALGGPNSVKDDPLAGLLDIVQRMAGDTHFEYDAATYVVNSRRVASRYGYGDGYGYGYPYRFRLGLSFGYPYRYGYYYDPFYDPFCYDPFWGWRASCYGYGFGYSFYRPRPYGFGRTFLGSGFARGGGSRFVIPTRGRDRFAPVQPRPRSGFSEPVTIRDRGVAPRARDGGRPTVGPRVQPRSSGDRPSVSRGWSGGSRPSGGRPSISRGGSGGPRGGGGGRRH